MSLKVSRAFVSRRELVERVVRVASSIYFMWYLADFPRKISASIQLSWLPVYSKVTHCIRLGRLSPLTGHDELNFCFTRFALSSTKLLILVLMAAKGGKSIFLSLAVVRKSDCWLELDNCGVKVCGFVEVLLLILFFLHWYESPNWEELGLLVWLTSADPRSCWSVCFARICVIIKNLSCLDN